MVRKPLYQRQLLVLIRSRSESGPPGTRSFLLPEPARRENAAPGSGNAGRPAFRPGRKTQVRKPSRPTLTLDMTDPTTVSVDTDLLAEPRLVDEQGAAARWGGDAGG